MYQHIVCAMETIMADIQSCNVEETLAAGFDRQPKR